MPRLARPNRLRGQRTRTAGGSTHAHKAYWVAGGLGFAVAAAVAVMLVTGGGGGGEGNGEGEGSVVAGGTAPAADAAPQPVAPPVVDAAPIAAIADAALPPAPQPPPQPPPEKRSGSSRREQPRGDGKLEVIVKPWGQVTVGTTDHGMAPTTLKLPAGKYRVRVRNGELGRDESITVEVRPGETTTVRRNW